MYLKDKLSGRLKQFLALKEVSIYESISMIICDLRLK